MITPPKYKGESFEVNLWDSRYAEAYCEVSNSHLVRRPQTVGPLDIDPPETCEVRLRHVVITNPDDSSISIDVLAVLDSDEQGEVVSQVLESIEAWD